MGIGVKKFQDKQNIHQKITGIFHKRKRASKKKPKIFLFFMQSVNILVRICLLHTLLPMISFLPKTTIIKFFKCAFTLKQPSLLLYLQRSNRSQDIVSILYQYIVEKLSPQIKSLHIFCDFYDEGGRGRRIKTTSW